MMVSGVSGEIKLTDFGFGAQLTNEQCLISPFFILLFHFLFPPLLFCLGAIKEKRIKISHLFFLIVKNSKSKVNGRNILLDGSGSDSI